MAPRIRPTSLCPYRTSPSNFVFGWALPRHLTSSSSTSNPQIPPESPKFIEVPQPPQLQGFGKRPVKGVLPIPRQIFPRGSPDKTSPDYLAAVTPEPIGTKDLSSAYPSTVNYVEWKARSAASRRKNLREGLVELQYRKEKTDRLMAARSAFKQADYNEAVHKAERKDERLTNPSITQMMTPDYLANLPNPRPEERIALKMENVRIKEEADREERRNALHSLYMNARSFIVTEAALNSKVDEVFENEWFKNHPGRSIWDKEDIPNTVQSMLNEANRSGLRAVQHNAGYAHVTRERVERIAEELTGGKM